MAHVFFQQWVTSEAQRASLGCRGAAGASAQDTHTDLWVSGTVQVCALRGNWIPARTVSVLGQREVIISLTLSIVWRCVGGVTRSLWGRCPPVLGQSCCCCCNSCDAESGVIGLARRTLSSWNMTVDKKMHSTGLSLAPRCTFTDTIVQILVLISWGFLRHCCPPVLSQQSATHYIFFHFWSHFL